MARFGFMLLRLGTADCLGEDRVVVQPVFQAIECSISEFRTHVSNDSQHLLDNPRLDREWLYPGLFTNRMISPLAQPRSVL